MSGEETHFNKDLEKKMGDQSVDGNVKVSFGVWVRKSCADRFFWAMDNMGEKTISMAFYRLVEYYLSHHSGYKPYESEAKDSFGGTHTVNRYFDLRQKGLLNGPSDPACQPEAVPKKAEPGP